MALQVVADGSDSNSTTVALGYATALIGEYAQELRRRSAFARSRFGGTAACGGSISAFASGSIRSSRAGSS